MTKRRQNLRSTMLKKNKSTVAIWALSFALLTAVLLLIFVSISSGASMYYARQAQLSLNDEARVLRSLLLDMQSLNQVEALTLVQRKYASTHIVKFHEQSVSIDSVL